MKLPPIPEQQALRAALPTPGRPSAESGQRHAALLQLAQSGVPEWVRAMVDDTAAELASSNQRHAVSGDRQYTATALAQLQGHREALIAQLVLAMQHQLKPGVAAAREAATAARAAQPLQLIDEAQIDEDIEIARIVQAIESESDWELRQLRALSSGLLGLPAIDERAAPLGPLACATGLRLALSGMGLDGGTRLLLMRVLGPALGRAVKDQYAELSRRLLGWGIDPAPYKVRQTPAAAPGRREGAPAAATLPSDESATDRTSSALRQLVESARQKFAPEDPAGVATDDAGGGDSPLSLRLFNDPLPAESARGALDPATAVVLMERLFAQIERHLGGSDATRRLLEGLQAPARALAQNESQLFAQPDHPWWKLLDRMITVGSVHDDGEADGPVTAALGLVVERMRHSPLLDRDTCQSAADEVQQVASRHMGERNSELGAQIDEMRHQVDREDLEATLRSQLVQQLRSTPVSLALRQFLVGPWTQVMTETTLRQGPDSRALDEHAFVVDDLIRATATPGKPVSVAQQRVLLRQVGLALASAGLPETRVEAEVADLKTLLRNPPPPHDEPFDAPVADDSMPMPMPLPPHPADDVTTAAMIDLQAGLPTVPIGMGADSTLEAATHQRDWLDALEPGACCRLFLLGRWMNAQLSWVSDSHNLFLFTSRHGGRTHSLTRRMLGKLRNAGLATTIEDGALLAQAMQQLVETDFAPG